METAVTNVVVPTLGGAIHAKHIDISSLLESTQFSVALDECIRQIVREEIAGAAVVRTSTGETIPPVDVAAITQPRSTAS